MVYIVNPASEHMSSGLTGDQLAEKFQATRTDPYTVTEAYLISGLITLRITWDIPFPPPMATCIANVLVLQGSNLIYEVCELKNCTAEGVDIVVGFYNGRSGKPGDVIQIHAIALHD